MRNASTWVLGLILAGCSATDAPAATDETGQGGTSDVQAGAAGSAGQLLGENAGSAGASSSESPDAGPSSGGHGGAAGGIGSGGHAGTEAGTGMGGQGGAGQGGAGGGPPHVVGACNNLGAIDHFDDITPPGSTANLSGVATVVVDPIHAGTLYVGTDHRGIFKSTNCGADWVKINTGKGAAVLDGGTLFTVELDPIDPNLIYAASLYSSDSSLYQSKNGGVDFEQVFPAGSLVAETVEYNFFQSMAMDPGDHRHVVVTFHANCKGQFAPSCLGETLDSGMTWRLFKSPLDGWGEGASSMVFGSKSFVLGTAQNGTYDTNDSGATWKKVGPGAYGQGHVYRSSDGYYYTGSDYGLQRTRDGSSWETIPNTFQAVAVIGDGRRLFSNKRNDMQPFYTSKEGDGLTWTRLASPNNPDMTEHFAYDADHHVLYSSHRKTGLWRVVTY
jgi:hypothetical protein